jgi:hypothetical protein
MALQASGPISFSQISNEFGSPSGKNLGAYRIGQTVGDLTIPLDAGIPTSGQIKFSDFYSKSLNVVVYCSGNRVDARSRYNDNNNVFVIGGYKTRPASSFGTKVWIHTNESISSNIPASSAPNRQYCSLITGGWEGGTDLRLDIGTSGVVYGAGGNGGNGGDGDSSPGTAGGNGTSAIGVNYQPIIITNRGTIQGGTGGGGGGGGAFAQDKDRYGRTATTRTSGGGGGGGMGSPAGSGGLGGTGSRSNAYGTNGTSGGLEFGGTGGVGGSAGSRAACTGGTGGDHQQPGGAGIFVNGDRGSNLQGDGGPAGLSGFGIIITNNGTGVTIYNDGSITPSDPAYNTAIS